MAKSQKDQQNTPNDSQNEDTETSYLEQELDRLGVVSEAHQFGKQDYNPDRSR